MPTVHAVAECKRVETFRTRQVSGMFDLPATAGCRSEFSVEIPGLDQPWSIGAIVGPSGSGKSTIARKIFGEKLVERWDWPADRSLLDGFPPEMGIREITELLSSVGFSSPPAWMRPFTALSNGEQFRVNLARTLAEFSDLAVVDEFTSVVDRTVAQIGSGAVARAVRRRGHRLVAVTCHYDVLPWLEPDWVLDMADGILSRRRLRRPDICISIVRVHSSSWRIFKPHHYLSADLNPASRCFVGMVEGRPAAFVSALAFPHPIRPGWREHRCVCLPDFQGLGIGNALSEFVASLYAATGRPYTSVTSHPAMMRHRARSPLWRMSRGPSRVCSGGSRKKTQGMPELDRTLSWRRMTASFQYIGPERADLAEGYGLRIRV